MSKLPFVKAEDEQQLEKEMLSHANVLILFTKKGCPHCKSFEEQLYDAELPGNVEVVEVPFDRVKTYDMFENLDVDRAPTGLMIKECNFAGKVVGNSEESLEQVVDTYKDAKDACRLETGDYKPIAQVVKEDED